ncbi:MAG: response regulator transcription factor [Planctomycetales bacterium]|nr:response regulator transcription factor [Planctomycetales bacterium]
MRVLVVEDYEPVRSALAQGLSEADYEVEMAGDGETGEWMALSGSFDVIVLDLMLPKQDGLSILQKLRGQGSDSQVIALTAKDTIEDRIHGLDLGADDYLTKPFDFGELLARVRALLRRKYQEHNPVITIADLAVDTVRRRVERAGRAIELTAREYALLEYLAMRVGEVVTRSDIWDHVYSFYDDAQSNVVDVYIGYLRRKIESPGLPKLIHTRRGHGYVLGEIVT